MFKKGLGILVMLTLVIGSLSACAKPVSVLGNTSGNANNLGIYAQQGDWIYYSDIMGDYHLSKMKIDGSEVSDLSDELVLSINVIGDWIYYVGSQEMNIYKIKTDGTGKTQLGTLHAAPYSNLIVQNDMIYFTNPDEQGMLYSMTTDGTNAKKLSDKKVFRIIVEGEWIYYIAALVNEQTYETAYELRKIKTNGTGDVSLDPEAGYNLLIDHDWLYYTVASENNRLYRIKTNGQGRIKLSDDNITMLNLANEKLYYTTTPGYYLKVCELDGSGSTQLIDETASGIFIVGDWLFFSSVTNMGRIFKVKLDGTQFQKAYTYPMVSPKPSGTPVVLGIGRPNLSINTNSTIIRSGDWLFYTANQESFKIHAKKLDGSNSTDISTHSASYLNTIGEWLYFVDLSNGYSLARIKKDGTEYGVIYDKPCMELLVKDDWMIFTDLSENHHLYKIKVDGTELTKLSDKEAYGLNLIGNTILYTLYPSEAGSQGTLGIYKVDLDGSNKATITNTTITSLVADDPYVIYTKYAPDMTLNVRRIKMDGTGDVSLIDDYATIFGAKDGWLYYNDGLNNAGLKRINLTGKQIENLIIPGNFAFFHFIEDKIVVYNNDNSAYTIMNLNGTDQQVWNP